VGSRNAENDRTVASFQVHRRPIHAVIETIQEEGASGKGAIKAPGAGTAGSCGGCDSNREVRAARLVSTARAGGAARLTPTIGSWRMRPEVGHAPSSNEAVLYPHDYFLQSLPARTDRAHASQNRVLANGASIS